MPRGILKHDVLAKHVTVFYLFISTTWHFSFTFEVSLFDEFVKFDEFDEMLPTLSDWIGRTYHKYLLMITIGKIGISAILSLYIDANFPLFII